MVGCTCAPSGGSDASDDAATAQEATIELGEGPGPLPVTLVLDPTGALCQGAVHSAAGRRHVVCDRSEEDLAAGVLKRGLQRLKAEQGARVAAQGVWLLAAPARAAVARSLSMQDPAFFSHIAVWVADSRATAGLFGPTFLAEAGPRGFRTAVLVGPGAREAKDLRGIAERQGIVLRAVADPLLGDQAAGWATLTSELSAELPPRPGAP